MLKLKDIVLVKNDKNEVVKFKVYDRVYFDFGPNDPTEEKEVTANDKPVQVNGENFKKVVPKNGVSVHPVNELVEQAISFIKDAYKDLPADKQPEPYRVLLGEASTNWDLGVRSGFRNELAPPKPVDLDKATLNFAKKLVQAGKYKTIEEAVQAAKALGM